MKKREASELLESCLPDILRACHSCRRPPAGGPGGERQARILDHLDPLVPVHPAALARHMEISPATVSLTLDRLEERGLVLRESAPGDARRVGIRLTAAGARLRDQRNGLDPDRVLALLGGLSPGKRRRALRGLRILAKAARRLHQGVALPPAPLPAPPVAPGSPPQVPAGRTDRPPVGGEGGAERGGEIGI